MLSKEQAISRQKAVIRVAEERVAEEKFVLGLLDAQEQWDIKDVRDPFK
jgi:hypothetical protein